MKVEEMSSSFLNRYNNNTVTTSDLMTWIRQKTSSTYEYKRIGEYRYAWQAVTFKLHANWRNCISKVQINTLKSVLSVSIRLIIILDSFHPVILHYRINHTGMFIHTCMKANLARLWC